MKKSGEQWEGGCHQLIHSMHTRMSLVCMHTCRKMFVAIYKIYISPFGNIFHQNRWLKPLFGRLAQLVQRTLSMREVWGSKP